MRFALVLVLVSAVSGCTRPTVLVCRSVSDDGVCHGPTTTIDVGRGYQVYATGYGMPHRRVTIRLVELRGGSEVEIARQDRGVVDAAKHLASPLRVSHTGRYRVEVIDDGGDVFGSATVSAPRPAIRRVEAPPSP